MQQHTFVKRALVSLAAFFLAVTVWAQAPAAHAYNNPELLPDIQTPIIDLAETLTEYENKTLAKNLTEFEAETGWKLRVLTQYDETPGRAVKKYWGLDDKSVLLVADLRGGNILNFNIGDDVYQLLPRTFWVELQTRYGNMFFVREEGEDQAIIQALDSIKTCLSKGGCNVVPGLPREQWILTLITSIVGGVIFGFAAHPRKPGQAIAWQWALIFSPLWGMLFIAFGIGPVITRTADWLPLFRNVAGFMIGALVAYLSPMLSAPEASSR